MADTPDADAHREETQNEALRQQLEAARRKRDSYQALLKDLPEIFEGKFRERLRPLQQRNEQMMLEGVALREQIRRTLPQQSGAGGLPAARPTDEQTRAGATAQRDEQGRSQPAEPAPSEASPPGPPGDRGRQSLRDRRSPDAGLIAAIGRHSRRHPWLLACGTAIAIAVCLPFVNRLQKPASLAGRAYGTAPGRNPALSVQVRTQGTSWLDVENRAGTKLLYGLLEGQRQFDLGQGLRLRAGRPDLVWIRMPGQPEKVLGSIDDTGWHTLPAPLSGR